MTVKRRAYTLMEILAVIAAIVIFMTLSAKAFRSLAADIPRAHRDFQVWMQSQAMVQSLKADIESAASMELKMTDTVPEQTQLLLQLPNKQVIYSLCDGQVLRSAETSQLEWILPHFKIQNRLWEQNNKVYAVEFTTCVERTALNNTQKKYEQSFVFFLEKQGVKP